jgi:peptidoglycan/xylan/chitin deacetylase (PgdA/CDA1 family)
MARMGERSVPQLNYAAAGRRVATCLPAVATSRWLSVGRLRILAYHDVSDPVAFDRQLSQILAGYRPVSAAEVIDAYGGGAPLPRSAVWVTFDDGQPGALRTAELLRRRGIRATAFVCPGVLSPPRPYWWQVVDAASVAAGLDAGTAAAVRISLKARPDADRRSETDRALAELAAAGRSVPADQATVELLDGWVEQGHDLGNHTWDHPVLDTCTDKTQEEQIVRAHDWLRDRYGDMQLFAYPNGNGTAETRSLLTRLGYRHALLFDMRLAPRTPGRFELSRLRVDAADPADRFRATLAGSLPALARAARRVSQVRAGAPA